MPGNPTERAKGEASRFALSMLKRPKFQDGGPVTGPLLGYGGGRTDDQAITVPAGAFVVPADVVSGLPSAQGNSLAGHNALAKLFSSLPLSPDEAPYGASSPDLPKGRTIPGLFNQHRAMQQALAKGGNADDKAHGEPVPILAANGEYIVHPVHVKRLGLGSLKRGHEILDKWVDESRKKNINTLKKLPGTVKN
jgi:hypothetical protein